MAENTFRARGQSSAVKPDSGGAAARLAPALGIVKDNVDPTRAGRIAVYILDKSGLDPDDKSNWRVVNYMSTFFGRTTPDAGQDDYGSYKGNPSSYGEWHSPPDIGSTVVCLFINGDLNYGFYIGCIPDPEALQMVPAIGATDNIIANAGEAESYGGAVRLPVTNINTNNQNVSNNPGYIEAPKPVHSYTAAIMFQQGILRDPIRGAISSSAQRETPSRVGWGVSTPGRPIYEGGFDDEQIAKNLDKSKNKQLRVVARRGGHSIVMDDGDIIGRDQLVRIRTALGHQILMSDDGQVLMILHSNGQSYIELGKEGTVDVYSTNSVNVRTEGDVNMHADNDVNIFAKNKLNIQATEMNVNTDNGYNLKVGSDYQSMISGKHTTLTGGPYAVKAAGQASMFSDAESFINGSKVNLNSGKSGTTPSEVKPPTVILHTDTLFDQTKGWLAAPGKLASICSRAPAHAPWASAGQGVDVKVKKNASSALPASPPAPLAAANQATAGSLQNPVTSAAISTVPPTGALSPAIDPNTTRSMAGQIAAEAAVGAGAAAVAQGAAVITTAAGPQAVVGALAQTPTQLEQGGVLKPGAATTINSMVQSGATVAQAMTDNMFTGKPGAQNLQAFVNNPVAQVDVAKTTMQQAQTQLQNAGVMTGKEAPTQIAGAIVAGATSGVAATVDTIKQQAEGALDNVAGSATAKAMAAGNFAAGLADKAKGLGSIEDAATKLSKSLGISDLLGQAQGAAASAFTAIKNSFKSFKPGVPQNLTAIAKENAANLAKGAAETALPGLGGLSPKDIQNQVYSQSIGSAAGGIIAGAAGSAAGGAISGALSGGGISGAVTGALTGAVNDAASQAASAFAPAGTLAKQAGGVVNAAASAATGAVAASASSLASGVSNLPGGQKALGAVVDNAAGAVASNLPGTGEIGNAIKQGATDAMNNIGSSLESKANGLIGGATSKLNALKNDLTSLASAGLPAGAAAQLDAAISAVGSTGLPPVKLPTVAVNTMDRSELTAAVSSVLGDPSIPKPNLLGGVSEAAKSEVEKVKKAAAEETDAFNKYTSLQAKIALAESDYLQLESNLPQGDPQVDAAYKKWQDLLKDPEYEKLKKIIFG